MKKCIKDEFGLVTRPEEAAGATGAFGPERLQETVAHYRHQELVSWLKMYIKMELLSGEKGLRLQLGETLLLV